MKVIARTEIGENALSRDIEMKMIHVVNTRKEMQK